MMEGFVPSGLVKRCSRTVNPARSVWNWLLCELPGARESNIKSVANRTVKSGGISWSSMTTRNCASW